MAKNIQIERFLQQNVEELSLSQVATMNIPAQFEPIRAGRFYISEFRFFLKRKTNGGSGIDVVCGNVKFPLSILWHKGSCGPLVDVMNLDEFLRHKFLTIKNVNIAHKIVNIHGMKREIDITTVDYVVE